MATRHNRFYHRMYLGGKLGLKASQGKHRPVCGVQGQVLTGAVGVKAVPQFYAKTDLDTCHPQ